MIAIVFGGGGDGSGGVATNVIEMIASISTFRLALVKLLIKKKKNHRGKGSQRNEQKRGTEPRAGIRLPLTRQCREAKQLYSKIIAPGNGHPHFTTVRDKKRERAYSTPSLLSPRLLFTCWSFSACRRSCSNRSRLSATFRACCERQVSAVAVAAATATVEETGGPDSSR